MAKWSNPTRAERDLPVGRRRRQAGFTLLELEAAVILLSLLIVGFMKLVWHHEELAAAGDRWCQDEPSFFVKVSDDDLERTIGVPARLVTIQPDPIPDPPDPDVYSVDVVSFSKTLDPPSASASVLLTLNP